MVRGRAKPAADLEEPAAGSPLLCLPLRWVVEMLGAIVFECWEKELSRMAQGVMRTVLWGDGSYNDDGMVGGKIG